MTVPVYFFTGFLESGKTTLIKDTLASPDFTENEKSLLICCEEGLEEYNEKELKKWNIEIFYVDNFEDLSYELFIELNKKYRPDRILIEFNGTWNTKAFMEMEMPIGWLTVQIVSCVDASTFMIYAQNMKQMIFNQLVYSDLIIFNRCDENTDKRFIRNNVKAINHNAQIIYESLDGSVTDQLSSDELPFDINADEIHIEDDDYGLFYMDALDNPDKYNNKVIEVKGIAISAVQGDKNAMVMGRYAMVCCAEDLSLCGILVRNVDRSKFNQNDWITVKGVVHVILNTEYNQYFIVLDAQEVNVTTPLEDAYVYFS
ncbi:MAG: GTP-binding protein [Erysipelotrichaceae bacterium]|uniref:TIGR03943 family putative permease subunit n=1 Tax=Floccifex sp. TaxID=2815810 RepID=UPI002A75434F|nr:GTP-binding protein [Floccifex sp.]MDD7281213.1 GTP-binding protein [Erysipelotrichaceae bacterium]MDY2958249.1 GTP-binding protein [Floccifex sp.]